MEVTLGGTGPYLFQATRWGFTWKSEKTRADVAYRRRRILIALQFKQDKIQVDKASKRERERERGGEGERERVRERETGSIYVKN